MKLHLLNTYKQVYDISNNWSLLKKNLIFFGNITGKKGTFEIQEKVNKTIPQNATLFLSVVMVQICFCFYHLNIYDII